MGSFKVKRLLLEKNTVDIFERQNLRTCKDVLSLTLLELQSLFGINYEDARRIQCIVSQKCVSDPITVHDLLLYHQKSGNSFFATSLLSLDILLQGGLPVGNVTEISGPPGVGKTQFCFLLSVIATLPTNRGGLDGQVMYIDTESAFSAERLRTIAKNRYPELCKTNDDITRVLQRIFVHKASTVCALKEIVPNIEKEIIEKKVKLVIIDSIASLFRKEYGASVLQSVVERNNILVEQAALLKDIAQTYGIVVFLTNQITSHSADCDPTLSEYFPSVENDEYEADHITDASVPLEPDAKRRRRQERMNTDYIAPALGVTWSHCVNTRLVAQFQDSQVRQLIIVKSPVAPNAVVRYRLNETGIIETDDDVEYISLMDQHNILTKYNFLTEEVTGTGTIFSMIDGMKL